MSNELPSTPEQWVAYLKDLTGVAQSEPEASPAVLTLPDDQNASPGLGGVRNGPSAGIPETHL